jgi:quercetin dioxygenase-like cupin family protein
MSLRPKEEIGEEIHTLDQFILVEAGGSVGILDGKKHQISDGTAVAIPAGMKHAIIKNSESEELKRCTLYSPPEHALERSIRPRQTRFRHEEHFDGKTTEP